MNIFNLYVNAFNKTTMFYNKNYYFMVTIAPNHRERFFPPKPV